MLQVATVEQGAIAYAWSYPYPNQLTLDALFEAVATQTCAPSKHDIAAASVLDDMAADWQNLELYLAGITPQTALDHTFGEPQWQGSQPVRHGTNAAEGAA